MRITTIVEVRKRKREIQYLTQRNRLLQKSCDHARDKYLKTLANLDNSKERNNARISLLKAELENYAY